MRVDRELQFYLGMADHVAPLRRAGLQLTYPEVSDTSKAIGVEQTFDIALADNLVTERVDVVTNDVRLEHAERILVISGPNQGGKTTLARTFGQLAHLAALGCPVPGTERAAVPAGPDLHPLRAGRGHRDPGEQTRGGARPHARHVRLATGRSLIVLNEIFNSTTVQDAAELSSRVLQRWPISTRCACASRSSTNFPCSRQVVSMVSTSTRTTRQCAPTAGAQAADGRAYAMAIARKYGLTYDTL